MKVLFRRISEEAMMPTFGHNDTSNAGIDFYATKEYTIEPHGSVTIPTFIAWAPIEIPEGYKAMLMLKGRSGLSINDGIELCNAGVIDEGFRGNIAVKLYNTTDKVYNLKRGYKIAQGIVMLLPRFDVEECGKLPESERGEAGQGRVFLLRRI